MSSAPARLVREEIEREVNSVPFWWHSVEINGEASRRIFFNELDVQASLQQMRLRRSAPRLTVIHRIGRWIIRNRCTVLSSSIQLIELIHETCGLKDWELLMCHAIFSWVTVESLPVRT